MEPIDPMDSVHAIPIPKPASYATTLLQSIGVRDFNSEVMFGDFTIEDEDFLTSEGARGLSFLFSQRLKTSSTLNGIVLLLLNSWVSLMLRMPINLCLML